MKKISFFLFALTILLAACDGTKKAAATKSSPDLDRLVQTMIGKYNSSEQAKADKEYYDISLVMTPIFPERTDGKWLYIEQAMMSKLEKPYRQRLYQVEQVDATHFTSKVYTIKDPLLYAGAQSDKKKLRALTFDKVELKNGCAVTLEKQGDHFAGGTTGKECPSYLRGAKYATSKITLEGTELQSWDQGFNEKDEQMWGATKGGYVFKKVK